MATSNYIRFTNKYSNNLRIMRACFNANLSDYGYHDYLRESRVCGFDPVDSQSFKKYMHTQWFGYLKERDFNRIFKAMVSNGWTLKETAPHVMSIIAINGDRTDM